MAGTDGVHQGEPRTPAQGTPGPDYTSLYPQLQERLGRDDVGYGITVSLKSLGIEVVPVADKPFWTTWPARSCNSSRTSFRASRCRSLLEQANSTRCTITDSGQLLCCGKALYGYRYDRAVRQRLLSPEEVRNVVRILEAIAAGTSVYRLCDDLLADKVPTPRGKLRRWTERTIVDHDPERQLQGRMHGGLSARAARGGTLCQRPEKGEARRGQAGRRADPRIVPDDLWALANKNLDRARRKPRSYDFWLKGRVHCGNCGRTLVRAPGTSPGNAINGCAVATPIKGCPNSYTHNKDVEAPAWERLLVWARDADDDLVKLAELESKLMDPSRANWSSNERTIDNLDGKLEDLTDYWADAPASRYGKPVADKMSRLGRPGRRPTRNCWSSSPQELPRWKRPGDIPRPSASTSRAGSTAARPPRKKSLSSPKLSGWGLRAAAARWRTVDQLPGI